MVFNVDFVLVMEEWTALIYNTKVIKPSAHWSCDDFMDANQPVKNVSLLLNCTTEVSREALLV